MNALEQLDVDLEVEGNLATFVFGLHLNGFVDLCADFLGQQLSVSGVLNDVCEYLVRIFNLT